MYQLKRRRRGAVLLCGTVGLMAVALAGPASAQHSPQTASASSASSRVPLMVVVSLNSQRVTVYAGSRKMREAPVSTGQSGYETPAGVYSVIQRRRDHFSNLYGDAEMPYMQRITWSGIALHAGALPGYPASHGCIRMPYEFAGQLFGLSRRGVRVLVVRDDMSPIDFDHPALFRPTDPAPAEDQGSDGARLQNVAVASPQPTRRAIAVAKAAAAEDAAEQFEQIRRAAIRTVQEAAKFEDALQIAEGTRIEAEAEIAEVDRLVAAEGSSARVERLNEVKARAQARLVSARAHIDAINGEGKAKIDAAVAARAEARAAWAANLAAQKELAASRMVPVSVFVSRKTQRLYVRHAFQPLFETEVTIQRPHAAIGTTVFTALNYTDEYRSLHWNVVSMYPNGGRGNRGEATPTNAKAAAAALERISIPKEAVDRINELVSPGSSLIISDEALSRETSEGTDFIVLMSGEPQGGVRHRSRNPDIATRGYDARGYDDPPSPPTFSFNLLSLF